MDSTERKKRMDRLSPHLQYLRRFKEPSVINKSNLVLIMKDLKDEGNVLFKEREFKEAGLFYTYALIVAHQLEKTFYHTVETEFLAVLYCNASLCNLRIEDFKEALKDADAALALQPGNIKGMFRRTMALEGLGQLEDALAQAIKGQKMDSKNNFDDLVNSLRKTIGSTDMPQSSQSRRANTDSSGAGSKMNGSQRSSSNSRKTTAASDSPERSAQTKQPGQGEKKNEQNGKKKKKKGQTQEKKQQSNKTSQKNQHEESSSAATYDRSDDDSDSVKSEDNEFEFAKKMATIQGAKNKTVDKKAAPQPSSSSHEGLDWRDEWETVGHKSDKVSQKAPVKTTSSTSVSSLDSFKIAGKPATKERSSASECSVDWPMPNFAFRLVCSLCFIKEKEGIGGYKLRQGHVHTCAHDVLIVRLKNNSSLNWLKIRPRLVQEGKFHTFAYKLCLSFQASQPCRIGESKCTFAHSPVEVSFWNLDRDEDFSIAGFIQEARQQGIFSSESPAFKSPPKPAGEKYIPGMAPVKSTNSNTKNSAVLPTNIPPPLIPQQPTQHLQASQPEAARHLTGIKASMPQHNFSVPPPSMPGYSYTQRLPSPPKPQTTATPQTQTYPTNHKVAAPAVANPFPQLECRILCPECLVFTGRPWYYMLNQVPGHQCQQSILSYRVIDELNNMVWVQVRERASHRNFKGNYVMCFSVGSGNPDFCKFKELCSFAHSKVEQALWKLEQEEKYDIGEFMTLSKMRSMPRTGNGAISTSSSGMYVKDLLDKFGGYFRFICRACFFAPRPMVSGCDITGRTCLGEGRHPWVSSRIVAHVKDTAFTPIDLRKFVHEGAFYLMCNFQQYCQAWIHNTCRFAHSQVEKALWMLERDTKITREELVQQSAGLFTAKQTMTAPPPQRSAAGQNSGPAWDRTAPSHAGQQSSWGQGQTQPQTQTAQSSATRQPTPAANVMPINVTHYCRTCWGKGQRSEEDKGKDKCTRGHSNFKVNSAFVSLPSVKEIRSLPATLGLGMKLVLCEYHPKCTRRVCNHPHGQEELDVWLWMLKNNIKNLSEVADKCKDMQKQRTRNISQGESVINVSKPTVSSAKAANQIIAPGDLHIHRHYCQYCGRSCNSDRQWDEHCMSQQHITNVNSDREHQWNFRQPPWGQGINLDLCARHFHNKSCQFSFVPDMYNMCQYAHSQEELDEWRERLEWRRMKRTVARDRNMFSYTESLLEEFHSQGDSVNVICEKMSDVKISCSAEPVLYRVEKNDIFTWTYEIHSKRNLEKVALLFNKDRLHFKLLTNTGAQHQIATGEAFLDVDNKGKACYKVHVYFTGGMFGSFSQWIIFDFGSRPVLVKKLSVEIGDQLQHERVKELREELDFDRWTSQNREIVRVETDSAPDSFTEQLLWRYKEPSGVGEVVTSDRLSELNQHNYVHKMHGLLELEEITRQAIISSYNLCCDVTFSQTLQEPGMFLIGTNGDLFIKINLEENLSQDTLSGKLVLSSVRTALLARADTDSNTVYEAHLVGENNYGYDGRGKEYVYLVITARTAKCLRVSPGQTVKMELQFQIDRRVFCRMHYALDSLQDTEVVFPDVIKFKPDLNELSKIRSDVLNEDQMAAVRHIIAQRDGYYPPFVMYGPFGTGKTETLAQATLALLKERRENCRILICTQSNSAADLYITKHLHAFFKKGGRHHKILRLNAPERRLNTVPEEVRGFCHCPNGLSFEVPTKEDIENCQLVITTVENSLVLASLGLHGKFSHIFVDEAGQALECEILMPLSLATTKTCVVLTGDHHQIGPTVYSQEARRQNFAISILVRLFNYYDNIAECGMNVVQDRCRKSPLNIFLSINYRTKTEILRFISSVFYGGPESLKAYGKIPSVMGITPIKLYAVQGKETQNADSTSYLNHAEAQEVVDRVKELLDDWPSEWGPKDPTQVAVISTYSDQVKHIRKMLRQDKSRPYLSKVDVGPIHSFQGKEVRALFITAVRTSNLLREPHIIRSLESGEDIGDLGFMSDARLLNTALTRTQSFAAVVGDPVALCLIGDCTEIWRTFLKHCSNMGSVEPLSYTYDAIKHKCLQIHLGPESRVIEMITKRSQESFKHLLKSRKAGKQESIRENENPRNTAGEDSLSDGLQEELGFDDYIETLSDLADSSGDASHVASKVSKLSIVSDEAENELSVNLLTSSEDILFQLARESLGDSPGGGDTGVVKSEGISVVLEKDGYVVLSYRTGVAQHEPFKIVTYDDEFVTFTVPDRDTGIDYVYKNLNKDMMWYALDNEPNRYVKCVLSVENHLLAHAAVVKSPIASSGGHHKDLAIRGSLDRGHALHGDTVVVELQGYDQEGQALGRVKGILERGQEPSSRLYVCRVDPENTNIMIPVNERMPQIYAVTSSPHIALVRKGMVCVYKYGSKKCIEFSNYEKVDRARVDKMLFIVRYLCWQPGFLLPWGIVVGTIDNVDSQSSGLKMLELEHNLHRTESAQFNQEIEDIFPDDSKIPGDLIRNRRDLRDEFCFSVADPCTEDIEWVISIAQTGNLYEVGVHVTDVVAYVKNHSVIDHECEKRGQSVFPLGMKARHMLPLEAATDMCSLKPGFDRLAVSVVVGVDESGELSGTPRLCRSIVKNKRHFTHAEVEDALLSHEDAESDYLKSCIIVLYQLAMFWRSQRLGNGHSYPNVGPEKKLKQHSHLMMDEVKLQFGRIMAQYLLRVFPETTPLLTQPTPHGIKLETWKNSHAVYAMHCLPMTRAFLEDKSRRYGYFVPQVCHCSKACTCVFSYIRQHKLENVEHLAMLKESWLTICQAVSEEYQDHDLAQELISSPEHMPQVWVAAMQLLKIQAQPGYKCSDHIPSVRHRQHYNHCLQAYTVFTNPVRNFVDLVVQRLIVAHMEGIPSPYNSVELGDLCETATIGDRQVTELNNDAVLLHVSLALKTRPVVVNAVILELDSDRLVLNLGPGWRGLPNLDVRLGHLSPVSVASIKQTGGLHVEWQERVYEHAGREHQAQFSSTIKLDPDRLVCDIPAMLWQRLLIAIREKNEADFAAYVMEISRQIGGEMELRSKTQPEVLCGSGQLAVCFSMDMNIGQVISVQLSSRFVHHRLMPCVQLVQLTPCLALCVEHRENAGECFTSMVAKDNASTQVTFSNEIAYCVTCLLPGLALESAQQAVEKGDNITIHSVNIVWNSCYGYPLLTGEFALTAEFCQRCSFDPQTGAALAARVLCGSPQYREDPNFSLDYLCVRYSGLAVPNSSGLSDNVAALVNNTQPVTWVGHCRVVEVIGSADGYRVKVVLVQSSMDIPEELLGSAGASALCTVEWISKPNDIRLMDIAARGLAGASPFVKDIVTGRQPVNTIDPIPQDQSVLNSALQPDQEAVIAECYRQPLAVVVGGPGTGKSSVAARIAHFLVARNRTADNFRQVGLSNGLCSQLMICGPTEHSLDLISVYLKVLNESDVNIVRVYSQDVEERDFPVSFTARQRRRSGEQKTHPVIEELALHHLIRKGETPEVKDLLEQEMFVSMYGAQASPGLQASIQRAQSSKLRRANIILCTPITSGRTILQAATNIRQIILDDASLIPEAETIVPLVVHKFVNQLIVLGDPNMPAKRMRSQMAENIGLSRSFLHRYADSAKKLTMQYRMTKSLATFPATFFYNETIETFQQLRLQGPSPSIPWPNRLPFVFLDIQGLEERSEVAALHCSLHDLIVNSQQLQAVIVLVKSLTSCHNVKEESILVIAATESQSSWLRTLLPRGVDVCTVLDTIGREWEYVIFSTVRSIQPHLIERPASSSWIEQHLGSMAEPKIMNMAITRVKGALFVIGNKELLSTCKHWQSYIAVFRHYQCLQVDSVSFLQSMSTASASQQFLQFTH